MLLGPRAETFDLRYVGPDETEPVGPHVLQISNNPYVHAPGRSPAAAAAPSVWWSVLALLRAVAGRPTPIDDERR